MNKVLCIWVNKKEIKILSLTSDTETYNFLINDIEKYLVRQEWDDNSSK